MIYKELCPKCAERFLVEECNFEKPLGYYSVEYWQEKCASLMDDVHILNLEVAARGNIIEDLQKRLDKIAEGA